MAVATFDTLKFANVLKAAGVPDKQAEAQATAFAEVMQVNMKDLVTRDDLTLAVNDLKREIADARDELRREIKDESQKLTLQLAKQAGDMVLVKWMLGATLTAVMGLFIRLFFFRVT